MFSNRSDFYVLLFGQIVYILGFISQVFSHFTSLFSWDLIRTELYRNWIRAMLMRRPVMILMVVKKGTVLILTGPKPKDSGSVSTSALSETILLNLRSPWAIGFETAVPRRTHSRTWWKWMSLFLIIMSAFFFRPMLTMILHLCVLREFYTHSLEIRKCWCCWWVGCNQEDPQVMQTFLIPWSPYLLSGST